MGVSPLKVSIGESWEVDSRNPNPNLFNIVKAEQLDNYVVALVNYPNCSNYEGDKIIVFENTRVGSIRNRDKLDPHFTEDNNIVARFKPTEEGWKMAIDIFSNMGP